MKSIAEKIWVTNNGWRISLYKARARCRNPSDCNYSKYGGRGIECVITIDEVWSLWTRDSASKMIKPTIDRIDPDGNYTLENCRFIEHLENSSRRRPPHFVNKRMMCGKKIHPWIEKNILITSSGRKCLSCCRAYEKEWRLRKGPRKTVIHHLVPGTNPKYSFEDEYLTCGLEPENPETSTDWKFVSCSKCTRHQPNQSREKKG